MKALVALVAMSSASWSAEAFAPARTMFPMTVPSTLTTSAPIPIAHMPVSKSRKLHMTASAAAMEEPSEGSEASSGGNGSISALLFNLVKSIVGAGVLSLPAGELS